MIEKILERFNNIDPQEMMTEEQRNVLRCCTEIVQEVAKEYGNGWILVKDRLPEEHKLVLIYAESTARGGSIRRVAQLHNGFWFVQTASDTLGLIGQYNVIKWAELPKV